MTTMILSFSTWQENFVTFIAESTQNPDWYDEKKSERLAYNKALLLAKKWDAQSAEKMLQKINTLAVNNFSRDVLELQGDVAYAQKKWTGAILAFYDRSLEIEKNPRVTYKKSLLLGKKPPKKSNQNPSQDIEKNIQKNLENIQNTQKNRSKYLDTNAGDATQKSEELDRIKRALGEVDYTPIKDW